MRGTGENLSDVLKGIISGESKGHIRKPFIAHVLSNKNKGKNITTGHHRIQLFLTDQWLRQSLIKVIVQRTGD